MRGRNGPARRARRHRTIKGDRDARDLIRKGTDPSIARGLASSREIVALGKDGLRAYLRCLSDKRNEGAAKQVRLGNRLVSVGEYCFAEAKKVSSTQTSTADGIK